jgi:hypothetical protein
MVDAPERYRISESDRHRACKWRRSALWTLAAFLASGLSAQPGANAPASAQTTAPSGLQQTPSLRILRVNEAPKLADYLSGKPVEHGVRVSGFLQREPNDGFPVSHETTAYLSYDDHNLYAVFVCVEDSDKVRARLTKRDDISADDQISLYLDTFRDGQRAYRFSTNPLGVQSDALLTEGQNENANFDALWKSDGRLTDFGFVVRMEIPFASLRFKKTARQTWGIALGRSIVYNNDSSFWPGVTLKRETFVGQFAEVSGLENISSGQNIQLIPYVAAARARILNSNPPGYNTQRDERIGIDGKIVIRDAFTFDATVHPDFSQVESDEPQVTLNRRFEVYFPEKRPFFLENSAFFETPENLFFTRRIINPEYGARLTGKAGGWILGLLATDDKAPGLGLLATDPRYSKKAQIGVLRVQREFKNQSRFGLFASTRDFGGTWNRTISFDARLRLSANWLWTMQAIRSYSKSSNGHILEGPAYLADLRHTGQHFSYKSTYTDRSPDFRAELGYIPRVDIRQLDQSVGYFFRPEASKVVGWGPSFSGNVNMDRQNRVQDWYGGPYFSINFTGPTGLNLSRFEYYQVYLGQKLRTGKSQISFYTSALKWLDIYADIAEGTDVNYNPAPGLLPYVGRSLNGSFQMTLRPTSRLRWQTLYYYTRLGAGDPSEPSTPPAATTVFNSHLLRSKVNYQFTRRLTLRAILDYYAVLPDPRLVAQNKYKRLAGDALLTYQVNSGTALYIGYTNQFENVRLIRGENPQLVPIAPPGTSTGAQVFVKLSYLLRF